MMEIVSDMGEGGGPTGDQTYRWWSEQEDQDFR